MVFKLGMTYIEAKRWITTIRLHIKTGANINIAVALSNIVGPHNYIPSAGMRKVQW
jgi:hypothetical protein